MLPCTSRARKLWPATSTTPKRNHSVPSGITIKITTTITTTMVNKPREIKIAVV
jgi:hypothetical protein